MKIFWEINENYKEIVDLLKNFQQDGNKKVIKVSFSAIPFDFFSGYLGSMNDEQGERFYQDLMVFEERHQGFWDENMLRDYC